MSPEVQPYLCYWHYITGLYGIERAHLKSKYKYFMRLYFSR